MGLVKTARENLRQSSPITRLAPSLYLWVWHHTQQHTNRVILFCFSTLVSLLRGKQRCPLPRCAVLCGAGSRLGRMSLTRTYFGSLGFRTLICQEELCVKDTEKEAENVVLQSLAIFVPFHAQMAGTLIYRICFRIFVEY